MHCTAIHAKSIGVSSIVQAWNNLNNELKRASDGSQYCIINEESQSLPRTTPSTPIAG